jgi:hypothetical protein
MARIGPKVQLKILIAIRFLIDGPAQGLGKPYFPDL